MLGFVLCGHAQDLNTILVSLSKNTNTLNGWHVSAKDTSVNSAVKRTLLEHVRTNTALSSEQVKGLLGIANKLSDTESNTTLIDYKFGDETSIITFEQFNSSGELTRKRNILLNGNEVREFHETYEKTSKGTNFGSYSTIYNKEGAVLAELPLFFSVGTLYNHIIAASNITCEAGKSSNDRDCYVISSSGYPMRNTWPEVPGRPVLGRYSLLLETNNLIPVEFNSFLANGERYCHIDLQFEGSGSFSNVCKRAVWESAVERGVWEIESIRIENDNLSVNPDTFIPAGTRVEDRRVTNQTLNFTMGTRPPNSKQVEMMRTNKLSVVRYEAKPYNPNDMGPKIASEKRLAIRITLIVILAIPVLGLLFKLAKRK